MHLISHFEHSTHKQEKKRLSNTRRDGNAELRLGLVEKIMRMGKQSGFQSRKN